MGASTFAFSPTSPPEPLVVQQAAVRAVAYADVFDFPLLGTEVHRYLHGVAAPWDATATALETCCAPGGPLSYCEGFYTLQGRENLVAIRRNRAAHAERLWPAALRYGRIIAGMPFVRMVAVTGSLTWDNADREADIDYLVVSEPDRLWLCRLFIALVARSARRTGLSICINYVISERALALLDRNVYTAYEFARMIPLAGFKTYHRMCALNDWTTAYLPNASTPATPVPPARAAATSWGERVGAMMARLGEPLLRTRLGSLLERLEMSYRIRKIHRQLRDDKHWSETSYTREVFKSHVRPHGRACLAAFRERLETLGVQAP